jgi:hypothetical protein
MRRSWERTYNIDIDPATKMQLWKCMDQERLYHNELVNQLNGKTRVLANEILAIKDQHERLWGAVAQTKARLGQLARTPVDTWPEALRPFHDIVVKDGKQLISEKSMLIYDIAAAEANLHPLMRKAIAMEILKCIQPQAKQLLSLNNSSGQMGSPVHMLQPLNPENKRHVQLLGTMAEISYDEAQNQSIIKIPYSSSDIVIRNQDLTKTPYDNIVIRQMPGREINANTPWQITIKEGKGRYMLDLIDVSGYSKKPRRK